jgi:uncharacterized protein YeaO (DUF488 family)
MSVRVVRLGTPRQPNEGLRLGTVRRPPRGVAKSEFSKLSHTTNFSVGCYCENEERCHRSLLREMLIQHGADVAV